LSDENQIAPLIKKYGNPNPPLWNRPETSIQIGFRKGTISKEKYEEDQKRQREQDAKESEQRHVTLVLYLASKIIGNSAYVTPEDTDERVQATAKTLTIWNNRRRIEDEESEIQRATEPIEVRKNNILSEDTKKKAENGETVEVQDGNTFKLIPPWNYAERAEIAEAEVAVLEEAIAIRKRRIKIYETVISQKRDNKEVNDNIAKMEKSTRRAKVIKPKIVQQSSEIMKALEHGEPSVELCKHFMENLEEFNEIRNEYNALRHQLEFLTDETANIPTFPTDLTTSEIGRSKSNAERIIRYSSYGR